MATPVLASELRAKIEARRNARVSLTDAWVSSCFEQLNNLSQQDTVCDSLSVSPPPLGGDVSSTASMVITQLEAQGFTASFENGLILISW